MEISLENSGPRKLDAATASEDQCIALGDLLYTGGFTLAFADVDAVTMQHAIFAKFDARFVNQGMGTHGVGFDGTTQFVHVIPTHIRG